MTLRHMKVYVTVYQTENVTKAAQLLNLTQPVVTRTIQEIEKYYGVCLFERINRRLHVTEAGKTFYNYALHIIDSFDQMEQEMRSWDELGILRVGATITLGTSLLPRVLTEFRQRHPGLQVRSTVSNGAKLQQQLLNNQLDFAVIEGSITDENLCAEAIAQDRLALILPPGDPRKDAESLTLEELAGDAFLLREPGSMCRMRIDQTLALHHLTVQPAMESVSPQAIIQAVHAGLGLSFLPENLVADAIRTGLVATRKVDDATFIRENHLVWHRCKFLTRSAKEFMELLRSSSYLPELP